MQALSTGLYHRPTLMVSLSSIAVACRIFQPTEHGLTLHMRSGQTIRDKKWYDHGHTGYIVCDAPDVILSDAVSNIASLSLLQRWAGSVS